MKKNITSPRKKNDSPSSEQPTAPPSEVARSELVVCKVAETEVYRNVCFVSDADYITLSACCTPSSSSIFACFPRRQSTEMKRKCITTTATQVVSMVASSTIRPVFCYPVFPDKRIKQGNIALSAQQRLSVDTKPDAIVECVFRTEASMQCHPITYMNCVLSLSPSRLGHAAASTAVLANYERLVHYFLNSFTGQLFSNGQNFPILFEGTTLLVSVIRVDVSPSSASTMLKGKQSPRSARAASETDDLIFGQLSSSLPPVFEFNVASSSQTKLRVVTQADRQRRRDIPLNFTGMGVGGLDEQLEEIIKSAFLTRALPTEDLAGYGITHSKGILLHGPPGTGKTLIARTIANMFGRKKVKTVNGPEIFSSLVGESEKNIREIFVPAEKEYAEKGDESDLHVIIFDEIDAICKKRGTRSGDTGVGDSVVNQLLTKIDGVDGLNNILIIAMTNRMDMLDEALLRSGRLDVHLYNGLPDVKGRLAIFQIHTTKLRDNNLLDSTVDLQAWAERTANFSGADIASLIRKAVQSALPRNFETSEDKHLVVPKELTTETRAKVTQQDFEDAFQRVAPTHGKSANKLNPFLSRKYLAPFNQSSKKIMNIAKQFVDTLQKTADCPTLSLLISGQEGTGKTTLAAQATGAPFVSMIEAGELAGRTDRDRIDILDNEFTKARQSRFSVLILDNVEGILAATPDGRSYSNATLMKLQQLLKAPGDSQLFVIATTSDPEFLAAVKLLPTFKRHEQLLPLQTLAEAHAFVSHLLPTGSTVTLPTHTTATTATTTTTTKTHTTTSTTQTASLPFTGTVGSLSMTLRMFIASQPEEDYDHSHSMVVLPLTDEGDVITTTTPTTNANNDAITLPSTTTNQQSATARAPATLPVHIDFNDFIDFALQFIQ
eukprot:TRINITY_DN7433_c0_g1_i2.p1 TRINITY_DN7433_c0_g1~~TRINITY_DN7433_c0_g1_i2.p1  ORF type:complete len:891 (-),score=193.07 TRINITY_DN7433_c0_g1_i2:18-2690(-)